MNEHFYMEIYLADTPHRRNAQHFGGGSEQLRCIILEDCYNTAGADFSNLTPAVFLSFSFVSYLLTHIYFCIICSVLLLT